jgi:GntR family transcriptional regulator / MocR family aminotransferase
MAKFQANNASDLLLELAGPGGPLHVQLTQALREAIRSGRLQAGSTLPPSRRLASELDCSRWVVTEAYAQLAAEGYVTATAGSGTRVRNVDGEAPRIPPLPVAPEEATGPGVPLDLAPGLPDVRTFPMRQWISAVRSAAGAMASADLGYPDSAGHPYLRQVLAGYLARVRGAQADPANLVITAGATDAIGLLCRVLRMCGHSAVALENPGWHRLREVLTAADLSAVPIPVDDQGLRADLLHGHSTVRTVIVSPAHQFPVGVVMTPQRRAMLLAWARDCGGLIIEDDYDAEFRYGRRPVGVLQGAGQSSVALIGSVTKTLSPAMGIGWMVTPPAMTPLVHAAVVRPSGPPVIDQLAFAAFVQGGHYDRHLRAARIRYRARRNRLVEAITARIPECRTSGAAAGLHMLMHLPVGTDAAAATRLALAAGVRVANLDVYRFSPIPHEPGLVLGYGNLADHQVEPAVARLELAIRSAAGRPSRLRLADAGGG